MKFNKETYEMIVKGIGAIGTVATKLLFFLV